ncbi:hypothetical protein [Nitrosospira briensis]|uniref:hypothetical protein n=1 Tax=Nitrosospira briensis TaxID=35799 RepID=UPI0004695B66|nr:hypothetical protein [Nitrosospira briensis]
MGIYKRYRTITRAKGTGLGSAEAALQSAESGDTPDTSPLAALRELLESHLSGDIPSEEESEIDLMIQLSGMVDSSTGNSE